MANRVRPKCPTCDHTMKPVFSKGPRGVAMVRLKDVFVCPDHGTLAKGRRKVSFL